MAPSLPSNDPPLPIPVSQIGPDYLLFSPDHISYLRRAHNITGVLTGSIPQNPSQNIFQGIPLRLLPEETKILVDSGICFLADDRKAHLEGLAALKDADRQAYLDGLRREGREIGRKRERKKEQERERWLSTNKNKKASSKKSQAEHENVESTTTSVMTPPPAGAAGEGRNNDGRDDEKQEGEEEPSVFISTPSPGSAQHPPSPTSSPITSNLTTTTTTTTTSATTPFTVAITPHTSYPPLLLPTPPTAATPSSSSIPFVPVPRTYPVFAHLHRRGYFLSPGLRFGCNYMAYPGDPLRFHSHFLVVGKEWDEKFAIMEVVGGGRLGTGVKKAFLLGGKVCCYSADSAEEEDGKRRGGGCGGGSTSSSCGNTIDDVTRHGDGDGDGNHNDDNGHGQKEKEQQQDNVRCFSIEWAAM